MEGTCAPHVMGTEGQRSKVTGQILFLYGKFCGTFLKRTVTAIGLILGGMVGSDLKLCRSRDGSQRSKVTDQILF